MLWIYSLELFLMSLASWAWLTILLMFTTYPVVQIWAVFNNIVLSVVSIFVMACYYYTGQEKKSAQPFSYFFLLIFRGLLVDWVFFVYMTWRVSHSSALAEFYAGTMNMYAMTMGLTLAFMTFSVIIAFSLVVYSVDHDFPMVDVFTLNMFLTLAAGSEVAARCEELSIYVLGFYMVAYLLINGAAFLIPDIEPLTVVVNLLVSCGWFYYVFGLGNVPMLICALGLVFLFFASELVLRYTTKKDDEAASHAGTPTPGTPRTAPPRVSDSEYDADPSAPSQVSVEMMSMLYPSQQLGGLKHVVKKRS